MFAALDDASTVLALNIVAALALYALCGLLRRERALDRMIFGSITATLLLTYMAWRWSDTLPPFEIASGPLWSYLFFTSEAVAVSYTLMSIVILFRHKDRSSEADAAQARRDASGDWPAVDIFICTYNEPMEVVEKSILLALAIDYDHKAVWVLDDTRRAWLRDYCNEVGANYVTRPDNQGAKAGNLNNGLVVTAERTNAPFILVLDADFAPQSNILRRMVGLFDDPKAAIVQSPQFFFNADPIQHNLGASESWVDDQRIFFDVFQPAKDAWGCAFCVGTSFMVRRDRLAEIGGFPHEAICEDLNLSCTMSRAGYRTHWLNERLSMGLSAEGLPEYITQRTRWCLGTIQVALLGSGPLRGKGYTVIERLHFMHCVLNWLCKPFIVLMLLAPAMYWFADLPAFQADYLSFLRFGVPTLLAMWAFSGWVSGSRTLPLFMEVTHTITAFAVTITLAVAAVKPFGRPFKVTEKGGDRSAMRVRWRMATIFGGLSLLSAFSIVWAFVSPDAAAEFSSTDFFNLIWAGLVMVLTFISFLVCFEYPRGDILFQYEIDARLEIPGRTLPVQVTRISTSQAVLRVLEHAPHLTRLPVSAGIALHLPGIGRIESLIVTADPEAITLKMMPEPAQHRELVQLLYAMPRDSIARQARMSGALGSLLKRGFGMP